MEQAIDFTPLIEQVLMYLSAIVLAVAGWAMRKLGVKFGVDADEKTKQRVLDAIRNGLKRGRNSFVEWVDDKDNLYTRNKLAREAANYAILQVPGAIKKMGYTPEQLERWAESELLPN